MYVLYHACYTAVYALSSVFYVHTAAHALSRLCVQLMSCLRGRHQRSMLAFSEYMSRVETLNIRGIYGPDLAHVPGLSLARVLKLNERFDPKALSECTQAHTLQCHYGDLEIDSFFESFASLPQPLPAVRSLHIEHERLSERAADTIGVEWMRLIFEKFPGLVQAQFENCFLTEEARAWAAKVHGGVVLSGGY